MRWLVVALCACYEAPAADFCQTQCTSACPDGYTCTNNVCVADDGHCGKQVTNAVAIGVGARHSCILGADHAISCWGDNDQGQIGAGGPLSPSPAAVTGTYKQLAVGAEHTCALTLDDQPVCWGRNDDGEAAGASSGPVTTPSAVQFATGDGHPAAFTSISAGGSATCAVGADGSLWCWGDGGVLGPGFDAAPARVPGTPVWTSVSVGLDHVCGITDQGVLCFGHNDLGQVDPSHTNPLFTPTAEPITGAYAVSSGDDASCALVGDPATGGQIVCWGDSQNRFGTDGQSAPAMIGTKSDWTAIKMGGNTACGIRAGNMYCWGFFQAGVRGDGLWSGNDDLDEDHPIGTADAVDIAIGAKFPGNREEHACSIAAGKVSCWGDNSHGELGSGPATITATPIEIARPSGDHWTKLSATFDHACATTDDGATYCWGADGHAQVSGGVARGDINPCIPGQPCDLAVPTRAPSQVGAVDELVTGFQYTCTREGAVIHCWGSTDRGELGDANTINGPTGVATVLAPGGMDWKSLSGGEVGTCALTADDTPWCWGQIPGVPNGNTSTPTDETTADSVGMSGLAIGDDFACGVRASDHSRICWRNGNDDDHALGTSVTDPVATPTAFPNATVTVPQTTAITAETTHACALDPAGAAWCWGSCNPSEAMGATMSPLATPTQVLDASSTPVSGCTRISTTDNHTCAVCNGQVLCWGDDGNAHFRLGRGTSAGQQFDPVARPIASTESFSDVAVFDRGGCALTMDASKLLCWGNGERGEVGNGAHDRNLPTLLGTSP